MFGGVLGFLMTDIRLGPNRDARLTRINDLLKEWYRANPAENRLPPILSSNLTNNGWYDFTGQAIKAAATRCARGFFLHLCQLYFNRGTRSDALLLTLLTNLCEFYTILYSGDMFLPDASLDRLRTVTIAFGEAYQALRAHCAEQAILGFPVRPKMHRMQHLPRCARSINPVTLQCYAEESLVGTTTRVWKRSMAGRYEPGVQRVVLTKRMVGLLLRVQVGL